MVPLGGCLRCSTTGSDLDHPYSDFLAVEEDSHAVSQSAISSPTSWWSDSDCSARESGRLPVGSSRTVSSPSHSESSPQLAKNQVASHRMKNASIVRRKKEAEYLCPFKDCGADFTTRVNRDSELCLLFGDHIVVNPSLALSQVTSDPTMTRRYSFVIMPTARGVLRVERTSSVIVKCIDPVVSGSLATHQAARVHSLARIL